MERQNFIDRAAKFLARAGEARVTRRSLGKAAVATIAAGALGAELARPVQAQGMDFCVEGADPNDLWQPDANREFEKNWCYPVVLTRGVPAHDLAVERQPARWGYGMEGCLCEAQAMNPAYRGTPAEFPHVLTKDMSVCVPQPQQECPQPEAPRAQDDVCFEQVLEQGRRIRSRDPFVVHGDGSVTLFNGQGDVRLYDIGPESGETGHITEIIPNGQEFELFSNYPLDAYCNRDANTRNANIQQGIANLQSQGMRPDVNLLRYDTGSNTWVFGDRP